MIDSRALSNRGAAHFELGNYQLCIDDCDYARSLIENVEEVSKEDIDSIGMGKEASLKRHTMISKLCFRKGRSLMLQKSQGYLKHALQEYRAALNFDSKNLMISAEIEKLELQV